MNTDFAHYYQRIRSKQKREALLWSLGLVALYLGAGNLAEFNLHTVWVSIPHFFDYLAETIPTLHWPLLFADGRTEGSLAYWGYRLNIQLPLIWETLQLALAATIFSVLVATVLAFLAAGNTYTPASVRLAIRTLVAFLRTMPELAWAVMFVMAFGIGAIPGFLALALHTIGSLTKLFYESIETASNKPVRGLAACGATPLQRMRFGLWPQVKPVFLSYSFMRLEINFRQSTILGLVGAGGIGQELMTNIKLDRYDQVSMTLLLIIVVVSVLDYVSGELRKRVVEGQNDSGHSGVGGNAAPVETAASGDLRAAGALPAHRRPDSIGDRAVLRVLLPGVRHYLAAVYQRLPAAGALFPAHVRLARLRQLAVHVLLPADRHHHRHRVRRHHYRVADRAAAVVLRRAQRDVDAAAAADLRAGAPLAGRAARYRHGDLGAYLRARRRHGAAGRGVGDRDAGRRAAGQTVRRRARGGGQVPQPWPDGGRRQRVAEAPLRHLHPIVPHLPALSLYQIESNTRSAAVLGFVGAGGIGLVYAENMRLWNWDVVMFITLILVVVVMIMDKVSSMLRNKYIIGEDIPLYQQKSQID